MNDVIPTNILDKNDCATMVDDILLICQMVFPSLSPSSRVCKHVVSEAFSYADVVFGTAAANEWAINKGWSGIPGDAILADTSALLSCGGSLEALSRKRLKDLSSHRLSHDRIDKCIKLENPERSLLLELANGIPVMTDPSFFPNGSLTWPKLSSAFVRASQAVECMVHDSHKAGLGFYFKENIVRSTIPGAHINRASHVLATKVQGRSITDCSAGSPSLNSEFVKEASDLKYGIISHPTIGDMARLAGQFITQESCTWDELILFKVDLKGAYTLLSFRPEHVKVMGLELSDGVTYFSLGGHFGWTGLPAAFQVITRALVWEIMHNPNIPAWVKMYVDDLFGVCRRTMWPSVLREISALIRQLLGEGALADEKTEAGRCVSVIGYTIDLDKRLVFISQRNHYRALYAFLSTDLSRCTTVKNLQKLGSLASRYGKICRFLSPMTRYIYRAYVGRKQQATVSLDEPAKLAIRLIRAILVLGLCSEVASSQMSRPIESFDRNPVLHVVDFDASLTGIGLLFSDVVDNIEIPRATATIDISSLNFGDDSSFQNTAEFMATVFAGRGIHKLKWSGPVHYRGDSISALSWLEKERVKSDAACPAGVFLVFQSALYGYHGSTFEHVAGVDNTLADSRSRGGSVTDLGDRWRDTIELDLQPGYLLPLCAPSIPIFSDETLWPFLKRVREEILRFSE